VVQLVFNAPTLEVPVLVQELWSFTGARLCCADDRRSFRSRESRSLLWKRHFVPTRSLVTLSLAAPVMRTVARMLLPSTSEPMIWARIARLGGFRERLAKRLAKRDDGKRGRL
jgi:hypothetical protein